MRLAKPVFLIWLLSLALLCMQGSLSLHALGHAAEQLSELNLAASGGELLQAGEHCTLCDAAALLASGLPASPPALSESPAVFAGLAGLPASVFSFRRESHPARAPPAAV